MRILWGAAWVALAACGSEDGAVLRHELATLEAEASVVIVPPHSGGSLGDAVASAGDVNGDGYDDVVIGDKNHGDGVFGMWGTAFVHHGSPDGISETPDWFFDGDHDVYTMLGADVAGAGDVNGDGFDDVVVGAPSYRDPEMEEGAVLLFLGSAEGLSTEPAWLVESDQLNGRLGMDVAGAGDVNGDCFDDVVVGNGSWTVENGFDDLEVAGRALLYLGTADGLAAEPAWVIEGTERGGAFGESISSAGDVDGDGFGDVIVGCPGCSNGEATEGRAFLFRGTPDGLESTASWTVESDVVLGRLGDQVSGAGDVNGDGYDDVLVDGAEDRAHGFYGGEGGLAAEADWTVTASAGDASFYGVASAGDVDGDGFADVLLTTPGTERVHLYLGSAAGLEDASAWTGETEQPTDAYGYSVATAGDVDDDGFDDVLVSAPAYQNEVNAYEGRVYFYAGVGVGEGHPEDSPCGSDSDVDSDSDTDTDADSDADTDSGSDADTDSDSDAGSDDGDRSDSGGCSVVAVPAAGVVPILPFALVVFVRRRRS